MKNYINSQRVKTLIVIRLRTPQTWLYKDVRKNLFVDGHEKSDMVENHVNFLMQMEELKPYTVEFYEDGAIKPKVYSFGYAMRTENRQPIIVITHDECTFSGNDGVQKAWTLERDTFLRPKRQRQGIMVLEFIVPFGRLNLTSLTSEKRQEIMKKTGLTHIEAVKVFE